MVASRACKVPSSSTSMMLSNTRTSAASLSPVRSSSSPSSSASRLLVLLIFTLLVQSCYSQDVNINSNKTTGSFSISETDDTAPRKHNIAAAFENTAFAPSYVTAEVGDVLRFHIVQPEYVLVQSSIEDGCSSDGTQLSEPDTILVEVPVNSSSPTTFFLTLQGTTPECSSALTFTLNPDEEEDEDEGGCDDTQPSVGSSFIASSSRTASKHVSSSKGYSRSHHSKSSAARSCSVLQCSGSSMQTSASITSSPRKSSSPSVVTITSTIY